MLACLYLSADFVIMVPIGLVYSIHDSTELAIQKMIDFSQRMIDVQSKVTGEPKDGWGINPVMKRQLELEIRTLQSAPRDAVKLRRLLENMYVCMYVLSCSSLLA